MQTPSEDRLKRLWSKTSAASDPAEVDSILMEFRDAVHERLEQMREEATKFLPDRKGARKLQADMDNIKAVRGFSHTPLGRNAESTS